MADKPIVKPQAISGFPEWLPEEKLVEERILQVIRQQFARFGFTPVETPAVERKAVLSAKGVVDKEIYALSRLAAAEGEDPSTEMALHFDLTVPLARYVAQHFGKLTFPFRRYQIQKVWRGERPQAGRFREFTQCDIDIVGNGSLDPLADAEIPAVIHAIFSRIGIGRYVIRINNRKLLQGYLQSVGVAEDRVGDALRAIDALEKIGPDAVAEALASGAGLSPDAAAAVVGFVTADADLDALASMTAGPLFAEGVAELQGLQASLAALGVPGDVYRIDLSVARGLDYYTGTVYETQLVDRPEIGSVCSGGRYDDLASTYIRQRLPGVGISIGLTRLLARLFETGDLATAAATPASVLVTVMDRSRLADYLAMAAELRDAGIDTELYTEPKKFPAQLKYADAKGHRFAVIVGDAEFADGTVQIKDLASGGQDVIARNHLAATLTTRLTAS